jgi:cytoskeletal protein CcmA (bactofilin family)
MNYYLGAKFMFFKSSPPDKPSEPEAILLENIPMASIPISENQTNFKAGELVVGEGVILNGSLEVPNKAMISGAINGDLKVHSLAVGITGKIEGKIDCQIADIAGHVKDDLRVNEFLILRAGSIISGNIYYKEIEIEKGAKIAGQLSML